MRRGVEQWSTNDNDSSDSESMNQCLTELILNNQFNIYFNITRTSDQEDRDQGPRSKLPGSRSSARQLVLVIVIVSLSQSY